MQVTKAVDYGLRALLLMSRQPEGRFFLQDLADQAALPRNYLVKILKSLSCAGLVRSHRGIKGGFSLARSPREITLREVVEAIDGPVVVLHCLANETSSSKTNTCAPEVFFRQLRDMILANLESHNLQELIAVQEKIDAGRAREACPQELAVPAVAERR